MSEFKRRVQYRGHTIDIREVAKRYDMIGAPSHVQMIERCYIDGKDMTHEIEPSGGGDLDAWEASAKECIDAYLPPLV